ncbi:hypothetical protein ALC62_14910 [Cyphomyrmex costatus]|uniref:Uncharacterized protein n=1 Tax=Cyphomyrmex costatus TaxID=456900 RepID=A0A195C0U5_9HYME|nr:hypothetical protein ALC62_14910 [Cyphomyrmex costatus]
MIIIKIDNFQRLKALHRQRYSLASGLHGILRRNPYRSRKSIDKHAPSEWLAEYPAIGRRAARTLA